MSTPLPWGCAQTSRMYEGVLPSQRWEVTLDSGNKVSILPTEGTENLKGQSRKWGCKGWTQMVGSTYAAEIRLTRGQCLEAGK